MPKPSGMYLIKYFFMEQLLQKQFLNNSFEKNQLVFLKLLDILFYETNQ